MKHIQQTIFLYTYVYIDLWFCFSFQAFWEALKYYLTRVNKTHLSSTSIDITLSCINTYSGQLVAIRKSGE